MSEEWREFLIVWYLGNERIPRVKAAAATSRTNAENFFRRFMDSSTFPNKKNFRIVGIYEPEPDQDK